MIAEACRMALSSFRTNRLRAVLSLIGIVIGVASVVSITSIAESGSDNIRKQFETFGLDAVTVYPQWGDQGKAVEFTPDLLSEMARSVPYAKAVLRKSTLAGQAAAGARRSEGPVLVVDSALFSAMGLGLDQGRLFDPADEYSKKPLVVLGAEAARTLFPEGLPVGKSLTVLGDHLTLTVRIVGVLAPKSSAFGEDWNRAVFLPYAFIEGRVFGSFPVQSVVVAAEARTKVVALTAALQRFFLDKTSRPGTVYIASPQEWAENSAKMTATMSLILTGVAAISLLVGGIGVMNIMLVSVAERRREIGIRKALGATPRHIQLQFLVESVFLTLAGGILGLGLGYAVSWVAVSAFHWAFSASVATALLAFGVSAGTGVFFGFYPAVRAARLDPIEALAAE